MKVTKRFLATLMIIAALPTLHLWAQSPNTQQGIKANDATSGGDIDTVSLTSGSLLVRVPIASFPQRGDLSLAFSFRQSGKQWTVKTTSPTGKRISPVWSQDRSIAQQIVASDDYMLSSGTSSTSPLFTVSVVSPDSGSHLLYRGDSHVFPLRSIDATGLLMPDSDTIIEPNGIRHTAFIVGNKSIGKQAGKTTDRNGNTITLTSTGWLDTLHRTIPGSPGVFGLIEPGVATSDLSNCPTGTASARQWDVDDLGGTKRSFKFCYSTVSLFTNFQQNGIIEAAPLNSSLLTAIVLPDLTSWSFQYDNYGDITKIVYPTGASISYTYVTRGAPGCVDQTPVSRWVATRTVDANDGAGGHQWTYTYDSTAGTVKVTDPMSNETVHSIAAPISNAPCSFYDVQVQTYQGSAAPEHLLTTVTSQYQGVVSPYNDTTALAANVVVTRVTTTLPGGKSSKVEDTFDAGVTTAGSSVPVVLGERLRTDQYDFAGTLIRSTVQHYKWQDDANFLNANLLGTVTSTIIQDAGGHPLAKTALAYDETTPIATGLNDPSHGAAPGPVRGNLTSTAKWRNTTDTMIRSTTTYFDTGLPANTTAPLGQVTSVTYSPDSFYTYPTQVTAPDTRMPDAGSPLIHHVSSSVYDLNTGLITQTTDENGNVTTFTFDNLHRPLTVNTPDGGQTRYCYGTFNSSNVCVPDTINIEVRRKSDLTAGTFDDQLSRHDGLGRVVHTEHVTAGGTVNIDTTYDAVGRASTVTNPYFKTTDSTYGVTRTEFDALGRVVRTTRADGSISSTQYADNCASATDEAGNQRKRCNDAFGHLTEVDEPTPGSPAAAAQAALVITGSAGSDSGTLTATVGSFTSAPVAYGAGSNATAVQVASALAQVLTANGSPVKLDRVSGSTVALVYGSPGAAGNGVVLTVKATSNQPASFPNGTFGTQTTFANGADAVPPSFDHPYKTLFAYDPLSRLICVEQHGDAAIGTGCSADPSNDATSPWRIRRFNYDSLGEKTSESSPESGRLCYGLVDSNGVCSPRFDDNGRLLNVTDARGVSTTLTYDDLGRLLGKTYSDGTPAASYRYDAHLTINAENAIGRQVSSSNSNVSFASSYDTMGRVKKSFECFANGCQQFATTFNGLGNLLTLTYPSGLALTYSYDTAGWPMSVRDAAGVTYAGTLQYFPFGAMQILSRPHLYLENGFNKRLQVTFNYAGNNAGTWLMYKQYNYDTNAHNNGSLLSEINLMDAARSQTFAYDGLDRLIAASQGATWGDTYQYDAWGNLLAKVRQPGTSVSEESSVTVDPHNRVVGYQYDLAGNLISDGVHTYTYDAENRLTKLDSTTYKYDADGRRISKSTGTTYWYGPGGLLAQTDAAGNWSDFVLLGSKKLARKDVSGALKFFVNDSRSTTSVLVDGNGTVLDDRDFYPWGGVVSMTSRVTSDNAFLFTGQERDGESGLDYFGARYYQNPLGRFLSADPVEFSGARANSPQQLNRYSYANDNPTRYIDSDGKDTIPNQLLYQIQHFNEIFVPQAERYAHDQAKGLHKVMCGYLCQTELKNAFLESHVNQLLNKLKAYYDDPKSNISKDDLAKNKHSLHVSQLETESGPKYIIGKAGAKAGIDDEVGSAGEKIYDDVARTTAWANWGSILLTDAAILNNKYTGPDGNFHNPYATKADASDAGQAAGDTIAGLFGEPGTDIPALGSVAGTYYFADGTTLVVTDINTSEVQSDDNPESALDSNVHAFLRQPFESGAK